MKKEKLDEIVHWANLASVIVVSISVIAIISAGIFFFYPKHETEISVKVNYTISIDTTKVKDDKIWTSIINRDVNKLSELSHVIFDELPKTVVDNVVNLIKNDELDDETYANIFEYIDLLILNLLRFEVLYKNENGTLASLIKDGSEYKNVIDAFFHKF